MGGNVWECTIAAVEERSVVRKSFFADFVLQVIGNSSRLVPWLGEVVAEASRARNPSYLRIDGLSPANRCDVRASTRELRCELWCLFAII